MKITFRIDYRADWGQSICIVGSHSQLGDWDETKAIALNPISESEWEISIEMDNDTTSLQYHYLLKSNGETLRHEWGEPHLISTAPNRTFEVLDIWKDEPAQKYFQTSPFSQCFFQHECLSKTPTYPQRAIVLQIIDPLVKKNEELILCGSSQNLGEWDAAKALRFESIQKNIWQLVIDASELYYTTDYKLAIYDKDTKNIVRWEEGNNRHLHPLSIDKDIRVESLSFRLTWLNWKAAGVAIPIFSLRSEDSFGIGEFSDLNKLVDWANATHQRVIQVLPINDTTITYSWTDSYPYNAISTYALHPIYLGLKEHPLKDKQRFKQYEEEAITLNKLPEIDYDRVIALKRDYIKDLYTEQGAATLKSKGFKDFLNNNKHWLFPYACFTFLRDKYKTANYNLWEENKVYDQSNLEKCIKADGGFKLAIEESYFTQYLLHKQLSEVKEYAHQKGVILKGDIPIGISRNSVEAWVEPHLFNLDTQTGAPPDDFSINGQNWGFPTYNWEEMAKDGYQWWIKRFRKMADYFDAYRIDHILGFFRIWEIPLSSVQGLLGYFNPALPLSKEEIKSWDFSFDEDLMTKPRIDKVLLEKLFGKYTQEVIKEYFSSNDNRHYGLKTKYNTQAKIQAAFSDKQEQKDAAIRDGLFSLCNEVLFIRDKHQPDKFHPRITAQYSHAFNCLNEKDKAAFNKLYDDYYYFRHTDFWRNEAMKKLPALISSTDMLVCGEDLGMIPQSVPSVMRELQILSLEIQRMPKTYGVQFEDMSRIPYMSVCTTSTHDMPPIRAWWEENTNNSQLYYNQVLHNEGTAPKECTTSICEQIIADHLYSPAMLAILPIQDWFSIDGSIRRRNALEEQINIPSVPNHYWKYRMHITLEELLNATDLNNKISEMIKDSNRI